METVKKPSCTFKSLGKCFARKEGRCEILNDMPKPMKDGVCPFYKTKVNKKGRWEWEWE